MKIFQKLVETDQENFHSCNMIRAFANVKESLRVERLFLSLVILVISAKQGWQ
jgi:hypothetical protein